MVNGSTADGAAEDLYVALLATRFAGADVPLNHTFSGNETGYTMVLNLVTKLVCPGNDSISFSMHPPNVFTHALSRDCRTLQKWLRSFQHVISISYLLVP